MKNLRKRALALVLCLTALFSLTGCGLQITIDVAPTATPLALPTSTSAATEETPTAPATALVPPTRSTPRWQGTAGSRQSARA